MRLLAVALLLLAGCGRAATPPSPTEPPAAPPPPATGSAGWSARPTEEKAIPAEKPWFTGCIEPSLIASAQACPAAGTPVPTMLDVLKFEAKIGQKPTRVDRSFAPRPLTPEESKLLALRGALICATPRESRDETAANVVYSQARTYFEAHHFAEAAALFHELAFQSFPDGTLAIHAAQLMLECINLLATQPPANPACQGVLRAEVRRLNEVHCRPPVAGGNQETCAQLERIDRELNPSKKP